MEPSKYSGAVAPGYHNSLSALTTTDADLEFTDLEEETFCANCVEWMSQRTF